MSARRTSINDVAEAAGVAIKTVSRVLNNEPNVREETRTRVLEVVKQLNYHPSLSARSLAGRRSYLIGLVDQTHVDGLIVTAPLSESVELIKTLDRRAIPFVRIAPNEFKHASPYA